MKEAYRLADALLRGIYDLLRLLDISPRWMPHMADAIYFLLILVMAWLAGRLAHGFLRVLAQRLLRFRHTDMLHYLLDYDVLKKASLVLPPLIVLLMLPLAFHHNQWLMDVLLKVVTVYLVITVVVSVNRILSSLNEAVQQKTFSHDRPLKSLFQLVQLLVVVLGVVGVVSFLMHRSPLNLITGLGAFAAVLMLVFRDTLLGFVAGVLLSQNKMVRVGDWIEVPGAPVNGVVTDITLTIVKVRNFDNTIATVPPYTLVSSPLVNWQAMKTSGGRQIKRGFLLKANEIVPCTPDFLETMKRFDDELAQFITQKQEQARQHAAENTANRAGLVNGTIDTNAGLLRAYLMLYLSRHPLINTTMLTLVRTMPPVDAGLPLQLYCYCRDTRWASYESVQSELMEHFAAVLPRFGFHVFQLPAADDFRARYRMPTADTSK